eukprot:TRINITY_DN17431_c0_g1_i1.p1 TRINITY_DN17431_c0_g1~~TRINITY_DN17431_c0_g1_i1.p1  ORF type:complete len:478 (+),score=168.78 TRINITY_DN17431_c0_g1_i1:1-1434(+)
MNTYIQDPSTGFQYQQLPNQIHQINMMNNQNMMVGNQMMMNHQQNIVQMNPQIQYIPIVPNNNNNFVQYQFQPFYNPQQQINFSPQQIPLVYPIHQQPNNVQYVYQQPVYIQVPYTGNMIEMQPMGPYKTNNIPNPIPIQKNNVVNINKNVSNKMNSVRTNNNVKNSINNHVEPKRNIITSNNITSTNIQSNNVGQKRCINCGGYYKDAHNKRGSCRYHAGKYVSSRALSALSKWSCCKEFDKNALGCKMDAHIEDVNTSHILSRFDNCLPNHHLPNPSNSSPFSFPPEEKTVLQDSNPSGQKEGILIDVPQLFSQNSTNNSNMSVTKNINKILDQQDEKELVRDKNGYYIIDHQVSLDDTLAGLALYYNTTVNEIKLQNNLFSNDIFLRKTLKIRTKVPHNKIKPHVVETKEHRETRLIRRFILFTNSKTEEARFYLTNNDWDVNVAVKEFKDDRAWENKVVDPSRQIRSISKKNF